MKSKRKVVSSHQKMKGSKHFSNIFLNFLSLFHQLDEIKDNIEKETFALENSLDDLRNIITPRQIGKFLLEVEKVSQLVEFINKIVKKHRDCKLFSTESLFLGTQKVY